MELSDSTDAFNRHAINLPAGDFTIHIQDDMRAYWNLEPLDNTSAKIESQVNEGYSVAAGPIFNRFFSVPAECSNFLVTFICNAGPNRAMIFRPDGSLAADQSFIRDSCVLKLSSTPETTGIWSILLISGPDRRDVSLKLEGLPPWISGTK